MQGKKIRISFLDILIYISLTFLCMQFFTLGNLIGFCKFFDSLGLKHIFMMLTVFVGFVSDLRKGKLSIKTFTYEIKMVVIAIVSLVLISFVYMAFNGYANYWISQVYFLAIPLLFAYTIFKNDFSKQRFKKIINYILVITSIYYSIFMVSTLLSGENLLSFSYLNSTSPFESEIAHFYLLMYMFYTFNNNVAGRLVSAFFCIMAWKRLCLVCLVLVTIAGLMRIRNKRISKSYIIVLTIVFTILPLLTEYMLSPEFSKWFNEFTGLDFIKFTNFRYYSIQTAIKNSVASRGLGTFFSIKVPWYGHFVEINMHNDLVRLYLEVGVVGLVFFLLCTGLIARRRFSLFVIFYLFIEMAGSHLIGNGGIPYWMLGYSLIFYFNRFDRDGRGNVFPAMDTGSDSPRLFRGRISLNKSSIMIKK